LPVKINSSYPDSVVQEARRLHSELRSPKKVAEILGVPRWTVNHWVYNQRRTHERLLHFQRSGFKEGNIPQNKRIITEREARKLFEQYKESKLPIEDFARKVGIYAKGLRKVFQNFMPDEYELVIESKKAKCKPYKKGRQFEYRVKNYLQSKGYFVLRSPRSAGLVDLVAIKQGEVLCIQCKTRKRNFREPERKKLIELAESIGAIPVLAYRDKPRYKLYLERLARQKSW